MFKKTGNILSVDLESFIHREFDLKKRTSEDTNFTLKTTDYLLDLFQSYNAKATFFVVGEIFDKYPEVIEKIHKKGHEIGYHTHRHVILKDISILLGELNLSKIFLKKYRPLGFRAPRMFMQRDYLKILSEFGFKYDSSVYGTKIEHYNSIGMKEIPVSMFRFFSAREAISFPQNQRLSMYLRGIPFGSGLFISILQKKIQYFIDYLNKQNKPAVIFVHPWQFFDYKTDWFFDNLSSMPKYFLYRRKINKTMEYLLSKNKFVPFKNLL